MSPKKEKKKKPAHTNLVRWMDLGLLGFRWFSKTKYMSTSQTLIHYLIAIAGDSLRANLHLYTKNILAPVLACVFFGVGASHARLGAPRSRLELASANPTEI